MQQRRVRRVRVRVRRVRRVRRARRVRRRRRTSLNFASAFLGSSRFLSGWYFKHILRWAFLISSEVAPLCTPSERYSRSALAASTSLAEHV